MDSIADSGQPNDPNSLRFFRWVKSHWILVLIAALGAAGIVYVNQFIRQPAFSKSDRWGLWAAAF